MITRFESGVQYVEDFFEAVHRFSPRTGTGTFSAATVISGTESFVEEIHTGAGTGKFYKGLLVANTHPPNTALPTFTFWTKRNGATTSFTITLYKTGTADAGVNAVTIKPVANATYEQFTLTPTGLYSPGDALLFELISVAIAGTDNRFAATRVQMKHG